MIKNFLTNQPQCFLLMIVCSLLPLMVNSSEDLADASAVSSNSAKAEIAIANQKKKLAEGPVRDLSQYPKVASFLNEHKVYVTLTSSPKRFDKIFHVLETLDLTNVAEVLISLPMKYSIGDETYDEEIIQRISQFPKVRILRPEKDLGPITKLIPGTEYVAKLDPEALVITTDDDIGYTRGMINEIIYQNVMNNHATVSGSGQDAYFWGMNGPFPANKASLKKKKFRPIHSIVSNTKKLGTITRKGFSMYLNCPEALSNQIATHFQMPEGGKSKHILSSVLVGSSRFFRMGRKRKKEYDKTHRIDVVEGFATIGYQAQNVDTELLRKFSDMELMKQFETPKTKGAANSCFRSDDLVISFTLGLGGVERKKLATNYSDIDHNWGGTVSEFSYGLGPDALHNGAGLSTQGIQTNEDKYRHCYKLLMDITYDNDKKAFKSRDEIMELFNRSIIRGIPQL
jgi:hypothetical protein